MKGSYLGKLLHLSDPTLPIGAYTHSNGLETYVQEGLVHNAETTQEYVLHNLRYNIKFNDAAFMYLAYRAAEQQDIETLSALDHECAALKSAREVREGSQKLGLRMLKIFERYVDDVFATAWIARVKAKEVESHYGVTFGLFSYLLGVPVAEALQAFLYNAAIGIITNAVKLVPLGQQEGQDIMFGLHEELETLAEEVMQIDRKLVGLCNVGFDIRCMQHERLYTRIYIS